MLWSAKGESWISILLVRLSNDVKPQRRKEGMKRAFGVERSPVKFDGSIPAANYSKPTKRHIGAPVGLGLPRADPTDGERMVRFERLNLHAARLIVINWLLRQGGANRSVAAEQAKPYIKICGVKNRSSGIRYRANSSAIVIPRSSWRQLKSPKLWDELWVKPNPKVIKPE